MLILWLFSILKNCESCLLMPFVSQVVSTFMFLGGSCPLIRKKLEEPFLLAWFIFPPLFCFLLLTFYIKNTPQTIRELVGQQMSCFFFLFLTDGCSKGSCSEILCFGGLAVHSSPLPHFINLNLLWGRCYVKILVLASCFFAYCDLDPAIRLVLDFGSSVQVAFLLPHPLHLCPCQWLDPVRKLTVALS